MTYKRIDGVGKDGVKPSTMFRMQVLKPEHFALVQEIIAHNGGNAQITLKNLWAAHMALRNRKYGPYFITKNLFCKTKTAGIYDLSRLRAAVEKPAKTKKVVAPAKPKKVAKPKRETKAKKGAPVEAPMVAPEVSVPEVAA